MDDLKLIIAQNIIDLRKNAKMTQAELAEKLNYSDKAVSKWERGESLPDVVVLKGIADLFSVTVDYFLAPHEPDEKPPKINGGEKKYNRSIITLLSGIVVWFVVGVVFVSLYFPLGMNPHFFKLFLICPPVDAIVLIVFNSIWGRPRLNYLIISLLVWSILFSLFVLFASYALLPVTITLLVFGILSQITIILWSKLKYRHKS